MRKLILIFAVLLPVMMQGGLLEKADSAYVKGNYEEAVQIYDSLLKTEGTSASLLFNLGNAYFKLGKDAEAILCYERAKKLDPGNAKINQNLEFLEMKVQDANKGALQGKPGNVEADQPTFIQSIYNIIVVDHRSNSWASLAVIAFILFIGSLSAYFFTSNIFARKTGFFAGLVFLFFSVIFVIFSFMAAHQFNRKDQGILMQYTTELRKNPDVNAPVTGSPLYKGTKVRILDYDKEGNDSQWVKVRLNSDNVGWVKQSDVTII